MILIRKAIFTLSALLLFAGCSQNGKANTSEKNSTLDSLVQAKTTVEISTNKSQGTVTEDSIVHLDYNLFEEIDLVFNHFTEIQFNTQLSERIKQNDHCSFKYLNLEVESHCDEICETYVKEIGGNTIMYLPNDYDAGILGMSFSPNCKSLIICSSYDGPDFDNYYENRAEVYLFKIEGTDGVKSLKPAFRFSSKEWSIEDYTWISDTELGLKIYEEPRWGDGSHLDFNYFKIALPRLE